MKRHRRTKQRRRRQRQGTRRQKGGIEDTDCPVCFSTYGTTENVRTKIDAAGHAVCSECVPRIVASGRGCPICRAPLLPQFNNTTNADIRHGILVQMCNALITYINQANGRGHLRLGMINIYGDVERILATLNSAFSRHARENVSNAYDIVGSQLLDHAHRINTPFGTERSRNLVENMELLYEQGRALAP